MTTFTLTVNGQSRTVDASPDMPLLWVLRDLVGLTGTKYGCGIGVCGSCVVLLDGAPARSCVTTIASAGDRSVTTIEGLSPDGSHPLQRAWIEEDVPQCGYCQAGMLMEAAALLAENPHPTDGDIDVALGHHTCRCGTYVRIRRAIHRAAGGGAQ